MKKTLKTTMKKSMSVFLSMLMLLSCWVFVAPESAPVAKAADEVTNFDDKAGTDITQIVNIDKEGELPDETYTVNVFMYSMPAASKNEYDSNNCYSQVQLFDSSGTAMSGVLTTTGLGGEKDYSVSASNLKSIPSKINVTLNCKSGCDGDKVEVYLYKITITRSSDKTSWDLFRSSSGEYSPGIKLNVSSKEGSKRYGFKAVGTSKTQIDDCTGEGGYTAWPQPNLQELGQGTVLTAQTPLQTGTNANQGCGSMCYIDWPTANKENSYFGNFSNNNVTLSASADTVIYQPYTFGTSGYEFEDQLIIETNHVEMGKNNDVEIEFDKANSRIKYTIHPSILRNSYKAERGIFFKIKCRNNPAGQTVRTLNLKWPTVNVTFNGKNGNVKNDDGTETPFTNFTRPIYYGKTLDYGSYFSDVTVLTRTGYEWLGWYTKDYKDLEGEWEKPQDKKGSEVGVKDLNVDLKMNKSTTKITSNTTYYANYWGKNRTLTIVDALGGTIKPSTITGRYGTSLLSKCLELHDSEAAVRNFFSQYTQDRTYAGTVYSFSNFTVTGPASSSHYGDWYTNYEYLPINDEELEITAFYRKKADVAKEDVSYSVLGDEGTVLGTNKLPYASTITASDISAIAGNYLSAPALNKDADNTYTYKFIGFSAAELNTSGIGDALDNYYTVEKTDEGSYKDGSFYIPLSFTYENGSWSGSYEIRRDGTRFVPVYEKVYNEYTAVVKHTANGGNVVSKTFEGLHYGDVLYSDYTAFGEYVNELPKSYTKEGFMYTLQYWNIEFDMAGHVDDSIGFTLNNRTVTFEASYSGTGIPVKYTATYYGLNEFGDWVNFSANYPLDHGSSYEIASPRDDVILGNYVDANGDSRPLKRVFDYNGKRYTFNGKFVNRDTGAEVTMGSTTTAMQDDNWDAQYDTEDLYTVTFKSYFGEIIASKDFVAGEPIDIVPGDQSVTSTVAEAYEFKGWTADGGKTVLTADEITSTDKEVTYTAYFEITTRTYTVKFVTEKLDSDGNPVVYEKTIPYGENISKFAPNGAEVEKADDMINDYTFNTWNPIIADDDICKGDAVYTALYSKVYKTYEVEWFNSDEDVAANAPFDTTSFSYTGKIAHMPAAKDSDVQGMQYSFVGWKNVDTGEMLSKDTNSVSDNWASKTQDKIRYVAVFKEVMEAKTVTYKYMVGNTTLQQVVTVEYGSDFQNLSIGASSVDELQHRTVTGWTLESGTVDGIAVGDEVTDGAKVTDNLVVNAIVGTEDHDFEVVEIIKAPTFTEKGEASEVCTKCGYAATIELDVMKDTTAPEIEVQISGGKGLWATDGRFSKEVPVVGAKDSLIFITKDTFGEADAYEYNPSNLTSRVGKIYRAIVPVEMNDYDVENNQIFDYDGITDPETKAYYDLAEINEANSVMNYTDYEGKPLQDGKEYKIIIKVVDRKGNATDSFTTGSFIYDGTAPVVTFDGEHPYRSNTKFCESVNVSFADEISSYNVSYEVKKNGEAVDVDEMDGSITISEPGVYVVTVTDAAGNSSKVNFEVTKHNLAEYHKDATCQEVGLEGEICTLCGYENLKNIGKIDHNYEAYVVKAVTCTEDGIEAERCTVCGEIREGSEVEIKAQGHQYPDEWDYVQPASCKADGFKYKRCTVCKTPYTETEPMSEKLHVEKRSYTEPATCQSEGRTYKICAVCGKEYDVEILSVVDHKADKWEVITPATCGVAGKEALKCSACDQYMNGNEVVATKEEAETREIPALEHKWEKIEVVAPTKDADGYTLYRCSICKGEEKRDITKYEPKYTTEYHIRNAYDTDDIAVITLEVGETYALSNITPPEKAPDEKVAKYIFSHWVDKDGKKVGRTLDPDEDLTEDVVDYIYPVYKEIYKYYSVDFILDGEAYDTTYQSLTFEEVITLPKTPTKESDIYSYVFTNWTLTVPAAVITLDDVDYTIGEVKYVLKEGDSVKSILDSVNALIAAEIEALDADEAVKAELKESATFAATGTSNSIVFEGSFDRANKMYTVTFVDRSGKTLSSQKVEAGTLVGTLEKPADQTKPYDNDNHYVFTGWSSSDDVKVDSDLVIKPLFETKAHDCDVAIVESTCTVRGSSTSTCKDCEYSKTETLPLKAHEWGEADENFVIHCKNCDAIDYATSYSVTFNFLTKNGQKQFITVRVGENATFGDAKDKLYKQLAVENESYFDYETSMTAYTFAGWMNGEVPANDSEVLTSDASYTTSYTETLRTYSVTVRYDGGETIKVIDKVPYGTDIASGEGNYTDGVNKSVVVGAVNVEIDRTYGHKNFTSDNTHALSYYWAGGKVTGDVQISVKFRNEAHKFENPTVITPGTCLVNEVIETKCACGRTHQETGAKAPHNWVLKVDENGKQYEQCEVCGETRGQQTEPEDTVVKTVILVQGQKQHAGTTEALKGVTVYVYSTKTDGTGAPVFSNKYITNDAGFITVEGLQKDETYTYEVQGVTDATSGTIGTFKATGSNDSNNRAYVVSIQINDNCTCACHRDTLYARIFRFFHKLLKLFNKKHTCCADANY